MRRESYLLFLKDEQLNYRDIALTMTPNTRVHLEPTFSVEREVLSVSIDVEHKEKTSSLFRKERTTTEKEHYAVNLEGISVTIAKPKNILTIEISRNFSNYDKNKKPPIRIEKEICRGNYLLISFALFCLEKGNDYPKLIDLLEACDSKLVFHNRYFTNLLYAKSLLETGRLDKAKDAFNIAQNSLSDIHAPFNDKDFGTDIHIDNKVNPSEIDISDIAGTLPSSNRLYCLLSLWLDYYEVKQLIELRKSDDIETFKADLSINSILKWQNLLEGKQNQIGEADRANTIKDHQRHLIANIGSIDREKRKMIVIYDEVLAPCDNILPLLADSRQNSYLPIKFSDSEPQKDKLYIAADYKTNLYVPYEDLETEMLLSKTQELKELLRCLGARRIIIDSSNEAKNSSRMEAFDSNKNSNNNSQKADITAAGAGSASVSRKASDIESRAEDQKNENGTTSGIKASQEWKYEFPQNAPSLPDERFWFDREPEWQSLAKDRLEYGLEEHSITISINRSTLVNREEEKKASSERKRAYEAKVKYKKIAGAGSSLSNDDKEEELHRYKVREENSSKISRSYSVYFYPMKEIQEKLRPSSMLLDERSSMSITIEEYKKAILYHCPRGIIGDSERLTLDSIAIALGIKKKDVAKFEREMLNEIGMKPENVFYKCVRNIHNYNTSLNEKDIDIIIEKERKRLNISPENAMRLISECKKAISSERSNNVKKGLFSRILKFIKQLLNKLSTVKN